MIKFGSWKFVTRTFSDISPSSHAHSQYKPGQKKRVIEIIGHENLTNYGNCMQCHVTLYFTNVSAWRMAEYKFKHIPEVVCSWENKGVECDIDHTLPTNKLLPDKTVKACLCHIFSTDNYCSIACSDVTCSNNGFVPSNVPAFCLFLVFITRSNWFIFYWQHVRPHDAINKATSVKVHDYTITHTKPYPNDSTN